MSLLPDYGLTLLRSGVHRDFQVYFYTLQLDHISAVRHHQFTTLLRTSQGGVDYALSLDFDRDVLDDIVEWASPAAKSSVRFWLLQQGSVVTLQLPELITFGVCASLGEEQRAAKETFVPFVIERVL